MAFCVKCGAQLADGAKFCVSCGEAVGGGQPQAARSATEKAGTVNKCLNCGAEIASFQTRCPHCGQEFKNARVSKAIQEFSGKISELDEQIARTATRHTSSEGETASPLKPLRMFFLPGIPDLSPAEKQKKSTIENFIVPNTREDIIEFILFSASKVESEISNSGKSLDKTGIANMWIKVWANKCEQVYTKAGVALAGDQQTLSVVDGIRRKSQQLVAAAKRRTYIKLGIVAAIIIAVVIVATGVMIKVPASTTISPDNVTITGAFDGYIQANEKGASLSANKDGTNVQMEIEFVSPKNITPYLEKYIADFKQDKGWQKDNCTQELYGYGSKIEIVFGDLKIEASDGFSSDTITSTISTLIKMEGDGSKKVVFPIKMDGIGASRKSKAKKVMESKSVQIVVSAQYHIENETLKAADKRPYWEYLTIK
jgi:hypothetical protein